MDAKVERLKQVAQSGDINAFYTLIQEDVKLLEYIDELPFADTPLHIAASAGQIPFAVEMMGLKPSFARKLDPNGFSPIHLALQNEHIELVRRLLQHDGDLVRVKGRERLTPLHCLVESGEHLDSLKEFLLLYPDSITDETVRKETALHIALKYNKLEAFQFLVEWLANNRSENAKFSKNTFLNRQDNEGNTVLHILVSKGETQAVTHLLSRCKEFVDVNHKNLEDKTAWDILQEDNREIRDMLRWAGAKPGSSLSTFNGRPNSKCQKLLVTALSCVDDVLYRKLRREIAREIRNLAVEWRSMLLVVAALLVTLCFQAVLTPPGGVWQDNGQCITTESGSSYHQIPPLYKTIGSSNHPIIIYLSQSNTTLVCEHKAGTAIALDNRLFSLFIVCNTMLFSLSSSLIVLLIPKLNMKILLLLLNITLCLSYFYSAWTITDAPKLMIPLVSVASIYFVSMQQLSEEPLF